jgi:large subunit ribosomal protein L24
MKTKFSKTWISSTQPRKQRKYRHNATLDVKRTFLSINLSKELRAKHGIRSVKPRTGDKVKVMRGTFKAKTGAIESIDAKHTKVFVTKIEHTKRDGSKSKIPLHPSNLMITELNLSDKLRKNKLTKIAESKAAGKKEAAK